MDKTASFAYSHAQMEEMRADILRNVSDLIKDAGLLFTNGRYARAYSIAVVAIEETTKVVGLLDCARGLDAGHTPDWQDLHEGSRDHRQKLMGNLLNFKKIKPGGTSLAVGSPEWQEAIEMVKAVNRRKQDGLYAAFEAGGMSLSSAKFSQADAAYAIKLAMISYNAADIMGRIYDGRRHSTPEHLLNTKLVYDIK